MRNVVDRENNFLRREWGRQHKPKIQFFSERVAMVLYLCTHNLQVYVASTCPLVSLCHSGSTLELMWTINFSTCVEYT